VIAAILAKSFERPTTKDFVFDCWTSFNLGGIHFCINFIFGIFAIAIVLFLVTFFIAFRRPKIVPGKFQGLMEMGIEFVREQIVLQMIGPEGLPFFALLATFFFMILFGNILEVVPGINFSPNSRLAFPLVLAVISWVTYNTVGIRKHGLLGYLKTVLFPPGAPKILYVLLSPIEFISVIVVRPITLSVRLFANLVAGHFLLVVFFLGTLALLQSGTLSIIGVLQPVFGVFAGALAVVLVGFELFVSLLQAFIFSVLSASYIAGAMAEEH
jgi:F-type H+-transporting ATPase subunit a